MHSMSEDKFQNCSPNQLNKCLYNGRSEITVNINQSSENSKQNHSDYR
jgi:hypothetical protein